MGGEETDAAQTDKEERGWARIAKEFPRMGEQPELRPISKTQGPTGVAPYPPGKYEPLT